MLARLAALRLLAHLGLSLPRLSSPGGRSLGLGATLLGLTRHLEQRRHAEAIAEIHRLAGRAHLELPGLVLIATGILLLLALGLECVVEQLLLLRHKIAQILHHAPGALLLRALGEIAGLEPVEDVLELG